MSLIVAVNKSYHSYFNPEHQGTLNPKKKFQPVTNFQSQREKSGHQAYQENQVKQVTKNKPVFARDIMTKTVHTIPKNHSVSGATEDMNHLGIHHLLVIEEDELVGLVSDRDLLRNAHTPQRPVSEIMSEKVLLCQENTEIKVITKVLLEEQISSIPVAGDDHMLQGIITRSDLLEFIIRNAPLHNFI